MVNETNPIYEVLFTVITVIISERLFPRMRQQMFIQSILLREALFTLITDEVLFPRMRHQMISQTILMYEALFTVITFERFYSRMRT